MVVSINFLLLSNSSEVYFNNLENANQLRYPFKCLVETPLNFDKNCSKFEWRLFIFPKLYPFEFTYVPDLICSNFIFWNFANFSYELLQSVIKIADESIRLLNAVFTSSVVIGPVPTIDK